MKRPTSVRAGLTAAAVVQLAVLALAVWPLVLEAMSRGTGVPGLLPSLSWAVLFLAGPSFLLLLALMLAGRRAVWFGVTLSALSLVPQLLLVLVGSSLLHALSWLLTLAALGPAAVSEWKERRWTRALGAGAALGALVTVAPYAVTIVVLEQAMGKRGGRAPDAPAAVRRAWGEGVYGGYLRRIEQWALAAPAVTRDVGAVASLAPVGEPNYYEGCFTDGCYAAMRLEVVGERGTGILDLPHVEIHNTGHIASIGDEPRWTFGGRSHLITKSGRTLLNEKGVEEDYQAFLAAYERKAYPEATRLGGALAEGLPWLYQREILAHLGEAMIESGRPKEALGPLTTLAETALKRADVALWRDGPRGETGAELRVALEALRKARAVEPERKKTRELARERVRLQRLLAVGGSRWPPSNGSETELARWGERTLGLFFAEAARYVERAPTVSQDVGKILSVVPEPNSASEVVVDRDGRWAAAVFLQVRGSASRGRLFVRFRENPDELPPVDLFADSPRAPDYPLKLVAPSWTREGGTEVRLGARTGEPR